MPNKSISSNRSDIQDTKYDGKKDWDELAKFKQLREDNDIPLIPFKHYEQ